MSQRGGFGRLLGANMLTNLGDGAALVAFPWLASTLTDSAFLVALAGVALRLPWLLFTLPAGVLADRLDRRHVLVATNAARALLFGLLALLVALEATSLPLLYACALALGSAEVMADNTSQVLLPAVVGRERLEAANGWLMSAHIVVNDFAGRPVGGVLVAAALALPFAFSAGTVALAAVVLLTLRGSFRAVPAAGPAAPPSGASMRAEIGEGVRWLWGHPVLRPLAISLALTNTATMGVNAIYVLYAREILHLDAVGYSLLLAAGGVGGLLGGLLAVRVSRLVGRAGSLVLLVLIETAAYAVGALSSNAYVVGAAMSTIGFGVVLWNVVTVSLRQTVIPDHLLGRVNSVYRLLGWGAMPLGMLCSGGLVALVEALAGREAGLRAPFVAVVLVLLGVLAYVRRHLHGPAIEAALAAAPPR
ncbi:MFS transporter [Streptomyces sp. 4N509B]|uniref:MFS transporter n=1 Tax=Streptomyces sp. 4N509B TaxID=3457413 RepID=UPI003FD104B7